MSAERRLKNLAGWTTMQQGWKGEWPLRQQVSAGYRGGGAALFYSLIETARLRGEDPGHYLRRAALTALENLGTLTLPKSQS